MTRRVFLSQSVVLPVALSAATDQWTPLFDGKTLKGWTIVDGPESAFYVKDGAITVHQGSNYPTWLRTDQEYENFEFKCEVFKAGPMADYSSVPLSTDVRRNVALKSICFKNRMILLWQSPLDRFFPLPHRNWST